MKKGRVYNDQIFCGVIEESEDKKYFFTYDKDYLKSGESAISVTLPLSEKPIRSKKLHGFFDGLIPEGWLLNIAKVSFPEIGTDRMELLLTVCQDCAGAVSVIREPASREAPQNERNSYTLKLSRENSSQKSPYRYENCLACLEPLNTQEQLYHSACSLRIFGDQNPYLLNFSLSDIEKLAVISINQKLSITGAQKKLSLSLFKETQAFNKDRVTFIEGSSNFILKPPPDGCDFMPADEHVVMLLAQEMRIKVAACCLIPLASGEICYLTKRFDRVFEGSKLVKKVAMEDFGQIFDSNINMEKYKASTEKVGKWLKTYASIPGAEVLRLFEQTYFSYLVGNNDMHLKNIAIHETSNSISLTPAFDLVSTQIIDPEKDVEVTLAIGGKRNKIQRKDWLELARYLSISQQAAENIILKYEKNFKKIETLISKSFLPEKKKAELIQFIELKLKKMQN